MKTFLEIQLIVKEIKQLFVLKFPKIFLEKLLKQQEIMTARMTLARDMEDFVGKYYSKEWFRTNILRQNEEETQLEDERIESELESESDGSEDEDI